MTHHTGLARSLREYVRAHPGTDSRSCAEALGVDAEQASRGLAKMARQGILSVERRKARHYRDTCCHYTLLRDITFLPRDEAQARRNAQKREYNRLRTEARRAANKQPERIVVRALTRIAALPGTGGETVEQWMARTGRKPDVLPPCQYVPARCVPMNETRVRSGVSA